MNDSWPLVPLEEILTERQEIPSPDLLANGEIHIVAKIAFDNGRIQFRSEPETRTGMILIRPGDLVISGINAAKGAIAVYDKGNTEPLAATIHYGAYIPKKEKVDVRYLWWLLRSGTFRELLLKYVPGGIKTELKAKRLLPVPIPLPSLSEQRRIVARIEEMAAKIEEARGLRRQTIEEAEALLNGELAAIFNALIGRTGSRQLSDMILEAGYGTSTRCDYERLKGSIPVLRIPNVASERVNFDDIKYGALNEAELQRVLAVEGDVLVVRTNGSADLVGRCAVVPTLPEPMAFASYMIRLRCDCKVIAPNFLQLMLKHLRTDGQLIDFARTTAGQYNVSLGRLRNAKLPVPSLLEQFRIVGYMDDLQAKVDTLTQLQDETAAELDAMLPSILDRAFRGEL